MLIENFNTFMYNQTVQYRLHICPYYLEHFTKAQMLYWHVNDCFGINGKQRMKMAKNSEAVTFKN